MQVVYDILGSMIIGGIILLMLLSFNSSVMEGSALQTFNSVVQSNMTSLTDMVEFEFRKMGYRVGSVYDSSIVSADSNGITFKADLDNDGIVETIEYDYNAKAKPGKGALRGIPLTRRAYKGMAKGPKQQINMGLMRFHLAYYDVNDKLIQENPVKIPSLIRTIRLAINMESTSAYDGKYAGATWERTITPKNLK